jgi:L-ascorbate metabolism protein UlaG (beta-lactamase superfamily)
MKLGKVVLTVSLATAGALAYALRAVPSSLGRRPRSERVLNSPQYADGKFHNAKTTHIASVSDVPSFWQARKEASGAKKPVAPIPLVDGTRETVSDGLHVTWYGHSSALIEVDGKRVLLDPIWSERSSPTQLVGPKRLHPTPIELTQLPAIDAVVISHDHYDHLDMESIKFLARRGDAHFVVPLGIGSHLEHWGISAQRFTELDWNERTTVASVELILTPGQHFSGRTLRRNPTLWGSWVIKTANHNVFYTGDTGYFPGFAEIGVEHGPFDVALVQIGAYSPAWNDIHMTPEEGVQTHLDVKAKLMIPVHWATFDLAFHAWSEPVERLLTAAKNDGAQVAVPRPGERVDVSAPPELDAWWREIV